MDEIRKQVGRARRRLITQQFLTIFGWTMFATLLLAVVALAIPKIWILKVGPQVWLWSWVGGTAALGLLISSIWTYRIRRTSLDAAVEIDRRFGLKERVSSALALADSEQQSEIGQALMGDAIRRVERLEIPEKFALAPSWRWALPLAPLAALVVLSLLPDATVKQAQANNTSTEAQQKKTKELLDKLKAKLLAEPPKTDSADLKDAEFKKELAKQIDQFANKEGVERKEAFLKINDLAKQIQDKKKSLGGADDLKKALEKLSKIDKGPADKLADALKKGDFSKAAEQLEKLQQDLKNDSLDKEKKDELAKQMDQMQKQIKELAQQQKEAKDELQKKIEQKMQQGDMAGAEKLQQKLDKMNEQGEKMQQAMEQLAQQLQQASDNLKKEGQEGGKQAADQMGQMAQQMKDLQKQLGEMENLDEMLDQLASAKDEMQSGDGEMGGQKGQQASQQDGDDGEGEDGEGKDGKGKGKGKGKSKGKDPGNGLGEGRGQGERPEADSDGKFYDSRVGVQPKKGNSYRTGDAGGKNIKGQSREERQEAIAGEVKKKADPQSEQALPRDQREHAKQYFERINGGK